MLNELNQNGYAIIPAVYTSEEVLAMLTTLNQLDQSHSNCRVHQDLFAIRCVTELSPHLTQSIFNEKLRSIFQSSGKPYRLVKSLYFDKPPYSNWFVFWHQDLTISVKEQTQIAGFKNWTTKNDIIGVQPPTSFLEDTITVRIHLDDCDEENGGLKVLPKTHLNGVIAPTQIHDIQTKQATVSCDAKAGDILLMKPLVLHASSKNTSHRHRRILHLEFSSKPLPTSFSYREEIPFISLTKTLKIP